MESGRSRAAGHQVTMGDGSLTSVKVTPHDYMMSLYQMGSSETARRNFSMDADTVTSFVDSAQGRPFAIGPSWSVRLHLCARHIRSRSLSPLMYSFTPFVCSSHPFTFIMPIHVFIVSIQVLVTFIDIHHVHLGLPAHQLMRPSCPFMCSTHAFAFIMPIHAFIPSLHIHHPHRCVRSYPFTYPFTCPR